MSPFRVALSGDFLNADGSPRYPTFDLSPLEKDPDIEFFFADPVNNIISANSIADADALILLGAKFQANSMPSGGRLAMVARFGVGYDTVDVDACTRNATAVVITPDGVRRPVAVTAVCFILALSQNLLHRDRLTRQGPAGWARRGEIMGQGLSGRTLGQLGVGNIGAEIFRLARSFDMKFIAHDPYINDSELMRLGVERVGLEDLFRRADFVSISCPLNDQTRGIVNTERIALMKPTAFLINTARGPIVDQTALATALRRKTIAGAALDVFEIEPTSPDEQLATLENVILSPHAASTTDQGIAGMGAGDIEATLSLKNGDVPENIVNSQVLDDERWKKRLEEFRTRFGNHGSSNRE